VVKNDATYLQGIPDLSIFWGQQWAMLEVKTRVDARLQPNQAWYLRHLDKMSFAAIIYPQNEEVVLDALQHAFGVGGAARVPEPQQLPLGEL
jgi:hypothetical protein